MSTIDQQPPATGFPLIPGKHTERKGSVLAGWLSSTDHKVIGYMYLITSFGFFLIAGLMAIIIRLQLFQPNNKIVSDQVYNELFTMHGTLMLLLFGTLLFIGFANVVIPLQIGAPDVAFPRMNLLSYYFFLFGGLILLVSFLAPGGAAAFDQGTCRSQPVQCGCGCMTAAICPRYPTVFRKPVDGDEHGVDCPSGSLYGSARSRLSVRGGALARACV